MSCSPALKTDTGAILIVDDDPEIRACIQLILEEEGYNVATAGNGQEALDSIAARRPDVVLLDLNMPVMSGWQFQERLRTQELHIPVVVMTAVSSTRAATAASQADGYLAKPFDITNLIQTVARFARSTA